MSLLGAALPAIALGPVKPAQAQEATTAAGDLRLSIALLESPQITPFELPPSPGAVRTFWLLMEPNAVIPTHDHSLF